MVFNSVSECIAYIEKCINACMPPLSQEIKKIMDEVTRQQVAGWSGQMFNSVIPQTNGMSASAGFENVGYWYSLISGKPVKNPIGFNEAGTVWNKGATSIMSTSLGRCESEVPQKFLQLMRDMGVPIS